MYSVEEILVKISERINYLSGMAYGYEYQLTNHPVYREFGLLEVIVLKSADISLADNLRKKVEIIDKIPLDSPNSFGVYSGYPEDAYTTKLDSGQSVHSFVSAELADYKSRLVDLIDFLDNHAEISNEKIDKIGTAATVTELAVLINILRESGFIKPSHTFDEIAKAFSLIFLSGKGKPFKWENLSRECSQFDLGGYHKFSNYFDQAKSKYDSIRSKSPSLESLMGKQPKRPKS